MPDSLQTLRDASMRVELRPGGLVVYPRPLAEEWAGFIRENKPEIVSLLQQEGDCPPAQVLARDRERESPAPWPAILREGPWYEIPAPDDAPEDLTGWRRWFRGPNNELCSVT